MNQIETLITPLVESQFPDFYREEGPLFVLFVKEYIKWLETKEYIVSGNNVASGALYHSRKLFDYKDIDLTVDSFLVHFKEKYLTGVTFDTATSKRKLVKAAIDLFRAKGTERSMDLLFKMVFGTKIEIYTPGDDVLKLSDGRWVIPLYLELSPSTKILDYVGKNITGSKSQATAFVEYVITRNINGKLIDIAYLSALDGDFEVDDIISLVGNTTSIEGNPKVTGSMTTVDVTLAGQDFSVGEVVDIISAFGVGGKAIVRAVETLTGLVQFAIVDGGWGFSTTANTFVSSKVLSFTDSMFPVLSYLSDTSLPAPTLSDYHYFDSSNNRVYFFDKFAMASSLEILKIYLNKAAGNATLNNFLKTTAYSSYKLYDVNASGSADLSDCLNFLKFSLGKASGQTLQWFQDYVMPAAIANSTINSTYLTYMDAFNVPLFSSVSQTLYNIPLTSITGSIPANTILTTPTDNTCVVVYSDQVTGANSANIKVAPINGNVAADSILYSTEKAVIVANNTLTFDIGDTVAQGNGSAITANGIVESYRSATILSISGISGVDGVYVGSYVEQSTTSATGYISVIPFENGFTPGNVNIVAISNTVGTFDGTNTITVYEDSSKTTTLCTATATAVNTGYIYNLTGIAGEWRTSNSVFKSSAQSTNTTIKIASAVGGKFASVTDVTATGNVIGVNTTSIGVKNITNAFYGTGVSTLSINGATATPNIASVSTGTGASFSIGVIGDYESVQLFPDRMSSNNDGPGSNSVKYSAMFITGANSTYGYMNEVYVFNGGSGYNNTDIVVFTGGNTGVGSFAAGNASLTTDASGNISVVTLTANVGSGYSSNPTITIYQSDGVTPTGGSGANLAAIYPLGFVKYTPGDISTPLLDILTVENKTIGTISTLTNINPGEDYNIDPFVLAYEPSVAAYGKRDYIINLGSNTNGAFVTNEIIVQTISTPGTLVTSNSYSGNTSNQYDVGEAVYSTDGITNVAIGTVYSSTLNGGTGDYETVVTVSSGAFQNTVNVSVLTVSTNTNFVSGDTVTQGSVTGTLVTSNSTTLIVKSVSGGSFSASATHITSSPGGGDTTISAVTTNKIYQLKGATSKANTNIKDTDAYTASALARARVKTYNANTKTITAKRISLFNEFQPTSSNNLLGLTSAANSSIASVAVDVDTLPVGVNATITGNVVVSSGSISSVEVTDSGFGYIQDETVSLVSSNGFNTASGKVNILNGGIGEGYYASANGFLDSKKYIHDGEYYQEYSYEVQSELPLDRYADLLKSVVHVAGTKLFGRIKTASVLEHTISVANSSITTS